MTSASTPARGQAAEDRVIAALSARGMRLVGRNVHIGGGELDVIAWDGDTLCFIEVRSRKSAGRFGDAASSVGPRKQARLIRAAQAWLAEHHPDPPPCRFDVVGITAGELRYLPAAFEVPQ